MQHKKRYGICQKLNMYLLTSHLFHMFYFCHLYSNSFEIALNTLKQHNADQISFFIEVKCTIDLDLLKMQMSVDKGVYKEYKRKKDYKKHLSNFKIYRSVISLYSTVYMLALLARI